jgi:hypothetical protein
MSVRVLLLGFVLATAAVTHAHSQTENQFAALKGQVQIKAHQKFQSVEPAAGIPAQGLAPRRAYVTMTYAIGDPNDPDRKQFIKDTVDAMGRALPDAFGNSEGAYTITLKIADATGTALVTLPIVSFQWTKQRQFIFFDSTVKSVQDTKWTGLLVNQMLVKAETQQLAMSIEAEFQDTRSLDFSLLKQTAADATSGALAKLLPLPAAAVPFIDAATTFLKGFYDGSQMQSLTDEVLVTLGKQAQVNASFSFTGRDGGSWDVPIVINIETIESKLTGGNLANGKFADGDVTELSFRQTQAIVGSKAIKIVDLLESADSAEAKSARVMLDALANGTYGKDPGSQDKQDINQRCGDLYAALAGYLTEADAAGMFWSFLIPNSQKLDRDKCVGSVTPGSRAVELAKYGLKP